MPKVYGGLMTAASTLIKPKRKKGEIKSVWEASEDIKKERRAKEKILKELENIKK